MTRDLEEPQIQSQAHSVTRRRRTRLLPAPLARLLCSPPVRPKPGHGSGKGVRRPAAGPPRPCIPAGGVLRAASSRAGAACYCFGQWAVLPSYHGRLPLAARSPRAAAPMIEVVLNDRLGKKIRVKCKCVARLRGWGRGRGGGPARRACFPLATLNAHRAAAQPGRHDWRPEEAGGRARGDAAREDPHPEVVQRLQGPHHVGGLRDSRRHGAWERRGRMGKQPPPLTPSLALSRCIARPQGLELYYN